MNYSIRNMVHYYISQPEVVSGSKYNNKVDIWSFSLISYFLLYGRHFFHFPSTCGISEKKFLI